MNVSELPVTNLWYSGKSVATEATYDVYDPSSPATLVGKAAKATDADVLSCIASATLAHRSWAGKTAVQRATELNEAIEGTESFRDQDARLLTSEVGKPLGEAIVDLLVFDVRWKIALNHYGVLDEEQRLESTADVQTSLVRSSLGVVTIIIPFNWPLAILAASLPQALLAGNTVIVKVPKSAPLASAVFLQRIAAKLPAGVLSVISGDDETMQPLINHQSIAKVCFTGSVGGGKSIMTAAANNLTRLTLELGGNDPAIILQDALLDDSAFDRIFTACFDSSGQICMNIKRIYVHSSRMPELVEGLSNRLEEIRFGHGLDPHTTHGPLHSKPQLDRAISLLEEASATASQTLVFGDLPEDLEGYFMKAALVINPAEDSRLVVEEQFAPIIPIIEFQNLDEAVESANHTWAGLGASVWGSDPETLTAVAKQLQAGYIWINDHGAARLDLTAPFGGFKQSGFGKEQGVEGLLAFTELKAIAHPRGQS